MSSILNPIGPEPPAVYWRRRLLVALGIVVVLLLLFVLFNGGSGGDGQPVAATNSTSSPSPTPSSSASSTKASASPSLSASPSATTSDVANLPECADEDIQVSAKVDKTSYPVGTPIPFTMTVSNTSDVECKRNVGPRVNTIFVTSGPAGVWSSDDCSPAGGDQIVAIPPNGGWAVQATWDQKLSQPGCPTGLGSAKSGSYDVAAKNLDKESTPTNFLLS